MSGMTTSPQFRVPNARAGQNYLGQLRVLGGDAAGKVEVRHLQAPPQLGLAFDETMQTLHGVPLQAGEYELELEWSRDGSHWQGGKCPLIVIADPRSLWKVLEPPADSAYPKAHWARQLVATGLAAPAASAALLSDASIPADPAAAAEAHGNRRTWSLLAASRRGRSHEHAGSFRDDDFFLGHEAVNGWSVLVVADGAGSASNSREGARLAAREAGCFLQQVLAEETGQHCRALLASWDNDPAAAPALREAFQNLLHQAAMRAMEAIEAEAAARQLIVRDYATTLLACCVLPLGQQTFIASFWIGDGAIAAYGPRSQVSLLGTPDSGEFAGQTRFLDRSCLAAPGFARRISTGRFADLSALMLMTDGVSDPRFETDSGLKNPAKWDLLWDELCPLLARPDAAQQVLDWLHFFMPGHHDDRTLALFWPATMPPAQP